MTIYAATSNRGKLAEFVACAWTDGIEVLALPDLADMPEPAEDADTFAGNAELKAVAYSLLAPGKLVLADDSGLCVDALGGAPGVRSARFADDEHFTGPAGADTNARNNTCLLKKMAQAGAGGSPAHFQCALALARDGEVLLRAEGQMHGVMSMANRGVGGFGYDPLLLIPAFSRSVAELTREEKWRVSHRGKAFRDLLEQIRANGGPGA